jgi:hypothetical protein
VHAIAAELGRIRGTNEPDDALAQSVHEWFHHRA